MIFSVRKVTPHWSETWKGTVANATGTHYMVPGTGGQCVDADGRIVPCPVEAQPRAVVGGQVPLANVPRSSNKAFRGLGLEEVEQQAALAQTAHARAAAEAAGSLPSPREEARTAHGLEATVSAVPKAAQQHRRQRPSPLVPASQLLAESEEDGLVDKVESSFLQESLVKESILHEAPAEL